MSAALERARFRPRKIALSEIEAISAIAAPRRVKILHGPVRVAEFNCGIARMFPGEVHTVPARAAYALVASGVAQYDDEPATVSAA